ncbi:MAG: leucyl aminopeptidase family protein [Candidatus Gracilibacteria bacterium]|nr:leucyl aminopeptidase family protein [Candidatus Gracilibacteria bacterium]
MASPFSLNILSNPEDNTLENFVIEVEELSNLDFFKRAHLPTDIMAEIESKSQEVEKASFTISTYCPFFHAKKLHILYIHDKSQHTKELSKILSLMKGDIALYTSKKDQAADFLDSLILSTYSFEQFLTKKTPRRLAFIVENQTEALQTELAFRVELLSCIYLVRDMVNMPPSQKYPRRLAEQIMKLPFRNTKVSLMEKKELETKGFGLLLGVASGSDRDPCVLVFERMIDKNLPTLALAGKGVTFDAGGLQIKPDDAMLDMKSDMAGAATVVGTLLALDSETSLRANIVAAIGLTENLLGGSAMKPLDILRSYNGKTVEIGHTDAEGRLVLGDLLGYLEATYSPQTIISVATLTGAVVYALGQNYAGIMGNNQEIITEILTNPVGEERFWQLPLDADMIENTKGEISDIKNVTSGYKAGSSMGAAFLTHFVKDSKLVHLDIAGPAYRTSAYSYLPKGGTGFGVMTLVEFLKK